MNDLTLEVREIDRVVVDHAERADPGSGEIHQQRRPQAWGRRC